MTEDEISKLRAALTNASSIDAIWAIVESAPVPFRDGVVSGEVEATFAALLCLNALHFGYKDDSNIAKFVGWNSRVAMCPSRPEEPKEGVQIQLARGHLGKLIRAVRWPIRFELTNAVIHLALERLDTERSKQACWLIGSVGWRTPQVESDLWKFAQKKDDGDGDVAFSVLVELGVPEDKRAKYINEAHRRYKARRSRPNLFALGHLGSARSLPLLTFPVSWKSDEEKQENTHFIPATISMIADLSENKVVARRSIEQINALFHRDPQKVAHSIYLAGNVVSSCDSEEATGLLLDQLSIDGTKDNPAAYPIYLLLHRLDQCIRPRQIAGFNEKKISKKLRKFFRLALTEGNEYTGQNATFEGDIKDHAWNLCLMLSNRETLSLAEKLIQQDKNPYARFKAMEDLSCFQLRPIPKQIMRWVTEKETENETAVDAEAILRAAALRVAWSSESAEGFRLLLESQYTSHGMTLSDSADGLAHLSVLLAKKTPKRRKIVTEIFKKFESSPSAPTAGMICETIQALAHSGLLSGQEYETLSKAILDEPAWIDAYNKTRIVSAVSTGPKRLISGKLRDKLIEWTKADDDRLATSCFEVLINADLISELSPEVLIRLGLAQSHNGWIYTTPAGKSEANGGLLVMLLKRDFDAFAPAFTSFLEFSSFRSFIQGIDALDRNIRRAKGRFAPMFSDALLRRAQDKNTFYDAEPFVVRALAEHDFPVFARQKWFPELSEWPAQSREELANAFLEGAHAPDEVPQEGISTLVTLHSDTTFGVRRAAFRALGILRPSLLSTIVRNFAVAETPTERMLAAEAIYWIPSGHRESDWKKLLGHLNCDVAEDVRDAVHDASQRARKLTWASLYWKQLAKRLSKKPNQDVLERWKYAAALVHLGDDQTIARLRHHLRSTSLPASYQRFLIKTGQTLEKNWEKCRSKWPEPMFSGRASYSVGEGRLLADGEEWRVQYAVWRNIDMERPNALTFGGITTLPRQTKRIDLLGKQLQLVLADGTEAKIFVNRIENQQRISFGGHEST